MPLYKALSLAIIFWFISPSLSPACRWTFKTVVNWLEQSTNSFGHLCLILMKLVHILDIRGMFKYWRWSWVVGVEEMCVSQVNGFGGCQSFLYYQRKSAKRITPVARSPWCSIMKWSSYSQWLQPIIPTVHLREIRLELYLFSQSVRSRGKMNVYNTKVTKFLSVSTLSRIIL